MPKTKRTIVYSEERLHEFFNIILLGSPEYYTLFWRLLLQTGLRPLHAYSISCGDIEFDKPQEDALGRTFYPIFIYDVLTREKHKVKETVYKKEPPVVTFISESLKKDIIEWCRKNNLTGEGYIFKDFFVLDAATTFIERRRKSEKIAHLLKYKPSQYIQYGLRHTWSSVLYAITSDVGVLIDLGGWGAAGVPLEHYRISMKAREALDIAKKWEMYIPPDKKDKVEAIERIVKEIEVPGAPVTVEAVDELKALLTTLQTQLQDERREREELEKRLAEKGL
jgi:integrase